MSCLPATLFSKDGRKFAVQVLKPQSHHGSLPFEQDATNLGALTPQRQIQILAESLDRIFPKAKSLELLEAGASQVSPTDELAGGSAFCYVGPTQKSDYLTTMC